MKGAREDQMRLLNPGQQEVELRPFLTMDCRNSDVTKKKNNVEIKSITLEENLAIKQELDEDLELDLQCYDVLAEAELKEESRDKTSTSEVYSRIERSQQLRTYSNKTKKDEKAINLKPCVNSDLCILCAKTFPHYLDEVLEYQQAIFYLGDINIDEHKLPKRACKDCIKLLDIAYRFKKQMIDSHTMIIERFDNEIISVEDEKLSKLRKYECIICDKDFNSIKKLKLHDMLEHGKLVCKECNYKSEDCDDFQAHKFVHTLHYRQEICCERCGLLCSKKKFATHILEHNIKKLLECTVCNCTVRDSLMKLHMKSHEEKYPCALCEKKFGTKRAFDYHRIKEHERTHVCKVCSQSFEHKMMLERHMRSHTGEKPFVCSICERAFSCKYNLHSHMRIHTNIFPYKCNYCEESFRHNVTRKTHQKKKHPEQVKEDGEKLIMEIEK